MYKFFFRIHLYASIIICPIILIFAITGCLMAFEPEIDHLVHARLYYVDAAPKALSLAALDGIVQRKFPKDTIGAYNLSAAPGISWQVNTNSQTIFINQYTGAILGTTTGPDFWNKAQQNIHQFHLRLGFTDQHDKEKSFMAWCGLILLVILPSGLVLWWKQKRLTVRRNAPLRQVWFDIHSLTGIVSFVLLFILAFTGVMIGFENQTTPIYYKLTGSKPTPFPDIKITAPAAGKILPPDQAVQIAAAALPGVLPFFINVPGPTDPYDIRCRYPEDRTPGGRSRVIIDPYSGKVLYAEGSRTAPAGTRLKVLTRAIHTGDIFGIFSKAIMALASFAMGVQVISGLRMWWLRKWKKKVSNNPV